MRGATGASAARLGVAGGAGRAVGRHGELGRRGRPRPTSAGRRSQRGRGEPIDFYGTDALVKRAALRNIDLLPVDHRGTDLGARLSAPRQVAAEEQRRLCAASWPRSSIATGQAGASGPTTRRCRAARSASGRSGTSPHLTSYWDTPAKSRCGLSTRLRQAASTGAWTAIKVRDPGAKVVLAGITQRAWEEIEELYRVGGIKGSFDVAALPDLPAHRAVARWSRPACSGRRCASGGTGASRSTSPRSAGRRRRAARRRCATWPTRPMAAWPRSSRRAYAELARERRSLGLRRVFWFHLGHALRPRRQRLQLLRPVSSSATGTFHRHEGARRLPARGAQAAGLHEGRHRRLPLIRRAGRPSRRPPAGRSAPR